MRRRDRFRAQPVDPLTGRRISITAASRAELERALARVQGVRAELRLGVDPAALRARIARPVTVDAAWRRWRLTVSPRSAATVDAQRRHLEPLARLDCRELTAATLGAWWADLRARVADATAAGVWQHLAQAVRLAVRVGELVAVPWGEWRPPRPSRSARSAPKRAACTSPAQLAALADAARAESPEAARIVVFLGLTGLRQGEAAALAWSDLDFASGALLVQRQAGREWWRRGPRPADPPKGGTPRRQLMHPAVRSLLEVQRDYLRGRGTYADDGPVWPGRAGAWRRSSRVLADGAVARWARAAGLPMLLPWCAHSLRHTCATLELAATGGDLRATAARTGHRDLEVLSGYLHATHPPESAIAFELAPEPPTPAPPTTTPDLGQPEPPARKARDESAQANANRAYARAKARALRAGATADEARAAGRRARKASLANVARALKRSGY